MFSCKIKSLYIVSIFVCIFVLVQATTALALTNTATIQSGTRDSDLLNNTASVTDLVVDPNVRAELQVEKEAEQVNVVPEQNLNYKIKFKNNGPDTATNVVIADVLPFGLDYVSATLNQQDINPQITNLPNGQTQIAFTIPTLLNQQSGEIIVTTFVNVNRGVLINTVTANAREADPVLANNSDQAPITVQSSSSGNNINGLDKTVRTGGLK